jgi:hypothetical protein
VRDQSEHSTLDVRSLPRPGLDRLASVNSGRQRSEQEPHLNPLMEVEQGDDTLDVLKFLGIEPAIHAVVSLEDSTRFVPSPL